MGECRKSPNIKINSEKHNYMQGTKASEIILQKFSEASKPVSKKTKK